MKHKKNTAILFYINLKKRKIMEIVYFVLGVVTVLLVLGVVVVVKVGTLVKELKEEVMYLDKGAQDVANDIHRRIDKEELLLSTRIDNEFRELQTQLKDVLNFIEDTKDVLHKHIDDEVKDILSRVDSRLDKLDSKIKQKDLLKG